MTRASRTLTFLFTDIEGSTRLWQQDRTVMAAALAAHDETLRSAVTGRGGEVFKHTGDGMCAAFETPSAAVAAALDAQSRLGLPVRMGIHTGEAEHRDGDYFGTTLNRVARLMDAGHGGQILVSAATAALFDDVALTDLGEHRLRDVPAPQRIWQVGSTRFPPLRVRSPFQSNLPRQMTSFVGRHTELTDLATLFDEHPLVTLTGVGGTGKTRLAVQFGNEHADRFPDGTWMVELGRLQDPGEVVSATASALGVVALPGQPMLDRLVEYFGDRRALLILDNCEHLLDEAADLAAALVESCVELRVLATSREALSVRGEQAYGVRSLATAGGDGLTDAARLFVDRVREERPGFELTEAGRHAVETICARLDGLPLAIELAAARAQTMGATEIAERLDERFRLLTGGRRGRVERHKTLRATVEWSYELLTESERSVFDRLSVFPATFDLDAAIAVGTTGDVEAYEMIDHLASLVAKSMVLIDEHPPLGTRYRLLETLRAFGHEQLDRSGSLHDARRAHAEHALASSRSTIAAYWSSAWRHATARLAADRPDHHAAMAWFLSEDRLDDALAVAVNFFMQWGTLDEAGAAALEAMILEPGFASSQRRSAALGALAAYRWARDVDLERAEELALESIRARTSPTDLEDIYNSAEFILSILQMLRGDIEGSLTWAQRLIDLDGTDHPHNKVNGLFMGSIAHSMLARHDEGLAMARELERHVAAHPTWCPGYTVNHPLGYAFMVSDPDRALRHFELGAEAAREGGNERIALNATTELLSLAIERGDPRAAAMTRDQIHGFWEVRDLGNMARAVSHCVVLCARSARFAEGAAIDGWSGGRGRALVARDLARYEEARAAIDEHLGADAERHRAIGDQWTPQVAVDHIVAVLDEIATTRPS